MKVTWLTGKLTLSRGVCLGIALNMIKGLIVHLTHGIKCRIHVMRWWPEGKRSLAFTKTQRRCTVLWFASNSHLEVEAKRHNVFDLVNTFKQVFKVSLSHYWTDEGFFVFEVSNSWKWWNSRGFVWAVMTDDSAVKIGHCPPLSFIMSVGQVWWREPGGWKCRSFIQNKGLEMCSF